MSETPVPNAARPRLIIILGSTRPGRIGLPVAQWLTNLAKDHGGFDVDLADLKEIDLPMMDEPNHPRLKKYQHEHTKAWSARVDAADAVVLVTPEYNGSYSAPLKNALDYLSLEWVRKPVGIVSYGGISAGSRAANGLRLITSVLGMVACLVNVSISMVSSHKQDDGTFAPPEATNAAAKGMLDELAKLDKVLKPLRP